MKHLNETKKITNNAWLINILVNIHEQAKRGRDCLRLFCYDGCDYWYRYPYSQTDLDTLKEMGYTIIEEFETRTTGWWWNRQTEVVKTWHIVSWK